MLWSLAKIIIFLAAVAAMAMGADYLLQSSDGIRLEVMGTEYTFSALQSVIGLMVLFAGFWVALKLLSFLLACWHFFAGDPTALSRFWDRKRERRGLEAVSQAMMALASGEGKAALAKAEVAASKLDKPQLTNLLVAQAAEMAGDRKKAEETYKKLITDERTKFVGVRGILKQKLADGDTDTAMKLAEKAFALRPRHVETQDILLNMQASEQDWSGARKTLSAKLKHGAMPRDLHRRRDAVLALSQAYQARDAGDVEQMKEKAFEANRLSGDLIPAAALAARGYIQSGQAKQATKVLKKAWEVAPHPDLAAAFAEIAPDETPAARLKRFNLLTRVHAENPETKMLLAELHIAAEDFPAARRALGNLVETEPTARSVTIMAAIERGEGASDTVVKGWLAKAITVPRGPQWICDACQHIHSEWTAFCENCGSFDTLSWRVPPMAEVASPTGMQMLPLIVGALEDQRVEPQAEVVEEESVKDVTPTEPPADEATSDNVIEITPSGKVDDKPSSAA